jgi:Tol biopolymer transport system component
MMIKKNIRICLYLCLSAALLTGFTGCAPVIQYSARNVPREVALNLSQVTTDKDSVAGCTVYWKKDKWTYDVRNRLSVSPDGSVMAFMNCRDSTRGITVMMLDGSYKSFCRPELDNAIDPCISPDGKRIVFVSRDRENWNIYETALSGGRGVRRITSEYGINVMPSYFRSQLYLIFTHAEFMPGAGVPQIYGYITGATASTGAITRYGDGFSACPVPNSTKVVTVRYGRESQTTELWLVDLASDSEKVIFSGNGRGALDPSVSPDGKTVAFVSMTEEKGLSANLDVYTIGINGANCIQRTFFEGNDICPRWAHSGRTLYFLSQRGTSGGTWNIWKIDMEPKVDTALLKAVAPQDTQKAASPVMDSAPLPQVDTALPAQPGTSADSVKNLHKNTVTPDSSGVNKTESSQPAINSSDSSSVIIRQQLDSAAVEAVKPAADSSGRTGAEKSDPKEW